MMHGGFSKIFQILGGGFKYFYFHPYLGKISNLTNIFQMGWNHHLEYIGTWAYSIWTFVGDLWPMTWLFLGGILATRVWAFFIFEVPLIMFSFQVALSKVFGPKFF